MFQSKYLICRDTEAAVLVFYKSGQKHRCLGDRVLTDCVPEQCWSCLKQSECLICRPSSCLIENTNLAQQIGRKLKCISSPKHFWTVKIWEELTFCCWMQLHTWWTSASSTSSLADLLTNPVLVVACLGFGALILACVTECGRAASSSHSPKRHKEWLTNEAMEKEFSVSSKFLINPS